MKKAQSREFSTKSLFHVVTRGLPQCGFVLCDFVVGVAQKKKPAKARKGNVGQKEGRTVNSGQQRANLEVLSNQLTFCSVLCILFRLATSSPVARFSLVPSSRLMVCL